jgi:hypothetical protein
MPIVLENFFQALVAGILVGGMYGLMCVGLGVIFGVMRVINFAQGDFLMLGMYVAYYLVTGFGILAFLGAYASPFAAACLAGPVVFIFARWPISVETGSPEKIDVPRSPRTIGPSQIPTWVRKGRSSPSLARMRAMSSLVA